MNIYTWVLAVLTVLSTLHAGASWLLRTTDSGLQTLVGLSGALLLGSLCAWSAQRRKRRVVILGTTEIAHHLAAVVTRTKAHRFTVQGLIAERAVDVYTQPQAHAVLGHLQELPQILQAHQPDLLVVARSQRCGTVPWPTLSPELTRGLCIEAWPTFYERVTGKVLLAPLSPDAPGGQAGSAQQRTLDVAKRLLDVLLTAGGLCAALPLMGLIALLIKCHTWHAPVLFRQERVGKDGQVFTLRKFRTMIPDAEKETGPVWSQDHDPRVTRLGSLLRRTGMDELPQLFNVLKGEMSLVGPRPERPHFMAMLTAELPQYPQRLTVKPGLTGWAQVCYGYGATLQDAQEKLCYDLYYIKHRSLWLDLRTILATLPKVFGARVSLCAASVPFPSPLALQDVTDSPLPQEAPSPTSPPQGQNDAQASFHGAA